MSSYFRRIECMFCRRVELDKELKQKLSEVNLFNLPAKFDHLNSCLEHITKTLNERTFWPYVFGRLYIFMGVALHMYLHAFKTTN